MTWKPKDWNRQQAAQDKLGDKGAKKDGFGTTIFVLGADAKPQPRRIRLGAADNRNSIVLAGELKLGDKVITAETDPRAKGDESASGRPPGA
jgi:multidrug efflux pump subunit AcrA (membrane-fusion protein)